MARATAMTTLKTILFDLGVQPSDPGTDIPDITTTADGEYIEVMDNRNGQVRKYYLDDDGNVIRQDD